MHPLSLKSKMTAAVALTVHMLLSIMALVADRICQKAIRESVAHKQFTLVSRGWPMKSTASCAWPRRNWWLSPGPFLTGDRPAYWPTWRRRRTPNRSSISRCLSFLRPGFCMPSIRRRRK